MIVPTNSLKASVERLAAGESLSTEQTQDSVAEILSGEMPEGLIAAFLTALRIKGETPDELLGAVLAVRERMVPWSSGRDSSEILDTCGTGGDGAGTVNVSTGAAIVAAACGVPVVKHGNRAASGNSGSSDVLGALGISADVAPSVQEACFQELGLAFLFAPRYHPGLRVVAPVRSQLPFRTLFNLVGPLCNPASPGFQLIGTPNDRLAALMAGALTGIRHLRRAVVVNGSDGLDEVTLDGATRVRVVEDGRIRTEVWSPEDFDLEPVNAAELRVSSPLESAEKLTLAFAGEMGPVRRIILANTAAALWTTGHFAKLADAVNAAATAIDSGAAARLVARWAGLTR